jgi:hypothetical protein
VDDRLVRLEHGIDQLRASVQALQARVDALESQRRSAPNDDATIGQRAVGAANSAAASTRRGREGFDPIVALSLLGRLFLVLAGGYFLRAMTEAGLLAPAIGVASAFAYGLAWLLMADRAGRLQQELSAVCHALGAALVVYPLVAEATSRFHVLSGQSAALVLAALTAGFLLVAYHRRLQAVAWITIVAALPTSLALLFKTGAYATFGLYLVALGLGTLWLAGSAGWTLLRWPVALVANVVIVGVTMHGGHHGTIATAVVLQLLLLGAYLGSTGFETLVRARDVTAFDVVQSLAVLVIGIGGAIYLTRPGSVVANGVGIAAIVLGAACYVVASRLITRHEQNERNVHFYASLALVFTLAGTALALPVTTVAIVLVTLAAAAAWAWWRQGRIHTLVHATAYVLAAGVASGALAYAMHTLAITPEGSWTLPDVAVLVVTFGAAGSAWLVSARPHPDGEVPATILRLAVDVVFLLLACGVITAYLAAAVAGRPDGSIDAGVVATVRTAVLAAASLTIAWLGSRERYREWAWLTYPMLIAIGIKMVAQDFNDSRPATLFIALACYGTALILAPRLRRAAKSIRRDVSATGPVGLGGT